MATGHSVKVPDHPIGRPDVPGGSTAAPHANIPKTASKDGKALSVPPVNPARGDVAPTLRRAV